MSTPTSETHALYRFYDSTGQLLYVGITLDPGSRWKAHSKEKPWWHDVAQVTVETHDGRAAVLEAERAAILAEKPVHNVVHNRGTKTAPRLVAQTERLLPIQVGDWAALGLDDGRCLVGEVAATDGEWVTLRLKNFMTGGVGHRIVATRWSAVERVELAYLEDARTSHPIDPQALVMDDEHLGHFQTAWERVRLGDARDPVDQALRDHRRELAQEARR